eukprot:gene10320-10477_t
MARRSRRLFVGCTDGEIHCYDIASSSRLAKLPGHRAAVMSLSTKPDTEQLLSASADAVYLWDMVQYRQRRMLGSAPYGSSQAVFSPAGNLIAAASPAGQVMLWNAKSLHQILDFELPHGQQQQRFVASCLSISPDEKWLLVGCLCPALLLVYSLQQRKLHHALQLPEDMWTVVQAQFLPDSTSAAVLSGDGCITFVDVLGGSCLGQLQLSFPGSRASSFSVDPRASVLAAVCSDGLVRMYDLAVVRARQQQSQPGSLLVTKLQEQQLSQLPASSEQDLSTVASSSERATAIPSSSSTAKGVLADVVNLPASAQGCVRGKPAARQKDATVAGKLVLGTKLLNNPAMYLNRRKLQELLMVYGEFPARYRQLIWDHLLQLPHNTAAFTILQDQGVHEAFRGLPQQLSLPGSSSSSSTMVRLQACLSQLAHWCPLFGEAGFLPQFAFPFVKLMGSRSERTFELVASLLLNWCKGWFEFFPNPPLPMLRRVLLLVCHHDRELGSHLQQLGVPLLQHLWQQLSGAMSESLPQQKDWLAFWDHCVGAAAGPSFMYSMLASYLIAQRQLLLAVGNEQQLQTFLKSRPPVDIQKVAKHSYMLDQATPDYARVGLSSFKPLSVGSYPLFNEYPVGSVELQQLERRRIQEAEDALIRRRQVVAELERRSKQVAHDSAALTAQRQQLAALDAQRRAALRAIDDSLATAGARLDDRSKEEKLKQIRVVEEAYQTSLSSLRAEWQSELAALKAEVDHKRRLTAAALKARQEEEDIKALEFQAQQRLWALQQDELAAAGSSALQDAAAAQAVALAAEERRRAAQWQAEDNTRALKKQHDLSRRARLAAAAEQQAARQAAQGLLLEQEVKAQEELLKVEHQRRLRQLAEDEAELTAQQLQLLADRQAVVAAAGQAAIQEQVKAHRKEFQVAAERRAAALSAEREQLLRQVADVHSAAADIGSTARLSPARKQLAQLEETLRAADLEHQERVLDILKQLQKGQQKPHQHSAAGAAVSSDGAHGADSTNVPAATAMALPPMRTSSLQRRLAALREQLEWASSSPPPGAPAAAVHEMGLASTSAVPADEGSADLGAAAELLEPRSSQPDRRAALEAAYGEELDQQLRELRDRAAQVEAAVPTALTAGSPSVSGLTSSSAASPSAARVSRHSLGAAASVSSSLDLTAELEQLLAETEEVVQFNMAHHTTWQAGSMSQVQRSGQLSGPGLTGLSTATHSQRMPSVAAAGAGRGERLRPVMEDPPAAAAAAALERGGRGGRGHSHHLSEAATTAIPARTGLPEASTGGRGSRRTSRAALQPRLTSPPTLLSSSLDLADAGLEPLTHWGKAEKAAVTRLNDDDFSAELLGDIAAAAQSTSDSSGQHTSSSQPSSVSFDVPLHANKSLVETADGAGPAEELMLAGQSNQQPARRNDGVQESNSQSTVAPVAALDSPEASRASFSGLDSSGRVSAELQQSSSATSEELEQLLQQISMYEEHLLEEDSSTWLPRGTPVEAASVGTSVDSASLSWSQTLAGLANLLPKQ